ncbi:HXXXD-type acyl-transferase family protein [Rhynchospora pubera]|uniref:HXXXD-type acyl-transferase family protein n=1 Tax=Rhynchospora pubera TaxID=906938 RepID=A0AAV8FH46_9POAL|nr:HXXXD-type acyl-transferase family protein [Rhynchospora pubera]
MVEVLESSFVVPSEQTPTERLWLSNIDQSSLPKHIPFVYFYEGNQAKDFFSLEVMKASLAKVLVLLYPLAGRCAVGQDGRREINCNAEGCLFVVARSDLRSDSITFEPSSELRKLFIPADYPGSESVLVMVQVTYLKCGGVVLGSANNHVLVDGSSFTYFIQTWAKIARGDVANIIPPNFNHNLIRARSPPTPSISFKHPEYTTKPLPAAIPKSGVTTKFKLSRDQIHFLKGQSGGRTMSTRISSFSTIAALVWKCYCISKGFFVSTQTRLMLTADIRRRLCPPLPKTYVGNAVVRKFATSEVSQITSNPVHVVAEVVQAAIDGMTDEFVRSFIDYLEMMQGKSLCPALELAESDLRIASISGLPIYEADFGWGAPQKATWAEATGNKVVYVMDEPGKNAGWQVFVILDADTMPQFVKAFYEELASCPITSHL